MFQSFANNDITAADAKKSALLTAHLLEGLREKFDDFYSKCVEEALSLGIDEPCVGRARKVPIRYTTVAVVHTIRRWLNRN